MRYLLMVFLSSMFALTVAVMPGVAGAAPTTDVIFPATPALAHWRTLPDGFFVRAKGLGEGRIAPIVQVRRGSCCRPEDAVALVRREMIERGYMLRPGNKCRDGVYFWSGIRPYPTSLLSIDKRKRKRMKGELVMGAISVRNGPGGAFVFIAIWPRVEHKPDPFRNEILTIFRDTILP